MSRLENMQKLVDETKIPDNASRTKILVGSQVSTFIEQDSDFMNDEFVLMWMNQIQEYCHVLSDEAVDMIIEKLHDAGYTEYVLHDKENDPDNYAKWLICKFMRCLYEKSAPENFSDKVEKYYEMYRERNGENTANKSRKDENMSVKIKKLVEEALLPSRGSDKAAAYDVYACIMNFEREVVIEPHTTVKVGTGLSMTPPEGFFVGIYARSGLSTKEGLRPANCVGVCDEDYTGEYIVALHNDSEEPRVVKHGDRIAQLILQKRYDMDFVEVTELDATERGAGGFGSTGK